MKPNEIASLVRVRRPPAPYGVRRLARCHSIDDLANLARRRLPSGARGYLDGGGEGEYTLRHNRAAFDAYEIVPRVLTDVSAVDTSTTVLGRTMPLPIVLAPVGAPRLIHYEGELAAVRAAGHARLPYGVSTLSTVPIDQIAAAAGADLWMQLYVWGDRHVARRLVDSARDLGYRVLLLSADVSVRSKRERELDAGIHLPTPNLTLGTVVDGALHPWWSWHFVTSPLINFPNVDAGPGEGHTTSMEDMFDGTVNWSDVEWLRSVWDGPLAVKGILSARDAKRAADAGVDAVVVSNHGGRQLDHVPATIDVLGDVVAAVGDRIEVLVDSGFRRGTDIFAALALGARAVLVGRAYLYGLAAAGAAGVSHAIDILRGELRTAMALAGAPTIDAIDPGLLEYKPPQHIGID